MKSTFAVLICSGVLTGPLWAAELKPTDPAAPAPATGYRSAFTDYKPFREEAIADWRGLNEEVRSVGGHRGVMGGHAGHGAGQPGPKPTTTTEGGQAPVRSAPQAPAGAGHNH